MALDDPYITVTALKARLSITGTADDAALGSAVDAASRQIDGWCARTFNRSATATAKYVTAVDDVLLHVPDLVSVSELATDAGARTYPTVWDAEDYDLWPFDAADRGMPYAQLRRSPLGSYAWPATVRGVRITAIWGWPAVPDPITEAAAIQAARLFSRKFAPFGLAGAGEFGLMDLPRLDPDVRQLIAPYRARTV